MPTLELNQICLELFRIHVSHFDFNVTLWRFCLSGVQERLFCPEGPSAEWCQSVTRGTDLPILSSNSCCIIFFAYLWVSAFLNKFSFTLKYSDFKSAILKNMTSFWRCCDIAQLPSYVKSYTTNVSHFDFNVTLWRFCLSGVQERLFCPEGSSVEWCQSVTRGTDLHIISSNSCCIFFLPKPLGVSVLNK